MGRIAHGVKYQYVCRNVRGAKVLTPNLLPCMQRMYVAQYMLWSDVFVGVLSEQLHMLSHNRRRTDCSCFLAPETFMRIRPPPFPSNRHHWSNGDWLEGKRENYQVCSAVLCATIVHIELQHIWTELTVLWIGFCITGPISLCLDSFLCMYYVWLYIACMCSILTWWGGPGGIEAWSLGPLLLSVLWHCWLGHLTRKTRPQYMTYNVFTGTLNPTQSVNQPGPSNARGLWTIYSFKQHLDISWKRCTR